MTCYTLFAMGLQWLQAIYVCNLWISFFSRTDYPMAETKEVARDNKTEVTNKTSLV